MIRSLLYASLTIGLCPLVHAQQQSTQAANIPTASLTAQGRTPAPADQPGAADGAVADEPQLSASMERQQIIRKARTISIKSDTVYLTVDTLERALMKQKEWGSLSLNILGNESAGDLELQINRLVFTHIHTYTITDRATNIVIASGRVRAIDGIVASGPMAEQIVKILAAAKQPAADGNHGQ